MRVLLAALLAWTLAACASVPATPVEKGRFLEWEYEQVDGLPPQHVTVWLPPGYSRSARRYPVLYMHDGQNLFDPANAHYGKVWHVDDVLNRMVEEGTAEPHIVVGIWSPGEDRYRQYLPQPAAAGVAGDIRTDVERMSGGPNLSAHYLRWLADTVKPRVDKEFHTRPDAADTTIIGSSMGGIMACYAAIERPDVFGRAGCVSAHWPIASPELAAGHRAEISAIWHDWLRRNLPAPNRIRLWLDHGTVGLDGYYAPFQETLARDLVSQGWADGRDFTSRSFEGAQHDELAWNARLAEMLTWLWRVD